MAGVRKKVKNPPQKRHQSRPAVRLVEIGTGTTDVAQHAASIRALTPQYLHGYIVEPDYALYCERDHAAWRFILQLVLPFAKKYAHPDVAKGLIELGLYADKIPKITEIDRNLKAYGWRAVAISGYIPGDVFCSFLSYGILPIACDMRSVEQIGYTPAPDLVHEAAGHAPLLINREYGNYLKQYGRLALKAISNEYDQTAYALVRKLSILKQDPEANAVDVQRTEEALKSLSQSHVAASEMGALSRMAWWTFEYGLITDPASEAKRIYGAGLISSLSEGADCLGEAVEKRKLTIDCVRVGYDITKPQPQLFVADGGRGFQSLVDTLEAFSQTLAFQTGGVEGLKKAHESRVVTGLVTDSGIEVCGVLERFECYPPNSESVVFVKYAGPCQLGFQGKQLDGHGVAWHHHGFSTALGSLQSKPSKSDSVDRALRLSAMTYNQVQDYLVQHGGLLFESGIEVRGQLDSVVERDGRLLILSFSNCTVTWRKASGDEVLFRPEWGVYDLITGETIVSVFGGPIERDVYYRDTKQMMQLPDVQKTNLTTDKIELDEFYKQVRLWRESLQKPSSGDVFNIVKNIYKKYPDEWLLALQILELSPPQACADLLHEIIEAARMRCKNSRRIIDRALQAMAACG